MKCLDCPAELTSSRALRCWPCKLRAKGRRHYARHSVAVRAKRQAWRAANPEKMAEYWLRAKLKGAAS